MSTKTSSPKYMDEALLREISNKYLLPFFSGATIEEKAVRSGSGDSTAALVDTQTIAFKVNRNDRYRLRFRRDQPFAQKSDPARETRVVEAFVSVLERMFEELKGPLKHAQARGPFWAVFLGALALVVIAFANGWVAPFWEH